MPAVLRQTTDKSDALWLHREIYSFKTFKLEMEGKITERRVWVEKQ